MKLDGIPDKPQPNVIRTVRENAAGPSLAQLDKEVDDSCRVRSRGHNYCASSIQISSVSFLVAHRRVEVPGIRRSNSRQSRGQFQWLLNDDSKELAKAVPRSRHQRAKVMIAKSTAAPQNSRAINVILAIAEDRVSFANAP